MLQRPAKRRDHQIHRRGLSLVAFAVESGLSPVAAGDRAPISLSGERRGSERPGRRRFGLGLGFGVEAVLGLSEAGRADRVQVPVRDHVLWVPQVPGEARVLVRFQERRPRGDRQSQPSGQGREARQDLT